MKQLMVIQINSPSPALERRVQNVAFASRCLDVIKMELAHGGGGVSSGEIITQGTDGVTGPQGFWSFDSSSSEP
jgi:hypothetical protein